MSTRTIVTIALCVVALGGCASKPKTAVERQPVSEPPERRAAQPPEDLLSGVMWAKLGYAREILGGLVTEDYETIERNAMELRRLSEHASWMVTDSVTYVVCSDEFREYVDDLTRHARAGDLSDATRDFTLMTETCIACHTYLRRERLARDYPERISSAAGTDDILSLLP